MSYSYRRSNPDISLGYFRYSFGTDISLPVLEHGPLGFDLEWRPNFKKGRKRNPVALVQIANAHFVFLIQVSEMAQFPQSLRDILESPNYIKTGVGIQHDVVKLYNDWGISTRNCVDLALLARSVDNARWKGPYSSSIGLARLVETYENVSLNKNQQLSNWEAYLSPSQQEYAANDAHAGFTLYTRLHGMLNRTTPIPRPSCFTFDCVRGRLCESSGAHWMPYNPNYDPGPPPPPKAPKPEKDAKGKAARDSGAGSSDTVTPQPVQVQIQVQATTPLARPPKDNLPARGSGAGSSNAVIRQSVQAQTPTQTATPPAHPLPRSNRSRTTNGNFSARESGSGSSNAVIQQPVQAQTPTQTATPPARPRFRPKNTRDANGNRQPVQTQTPTQTTTPPAHSRPRFRSKSTRNANGNFRPRETNSSNAVTRQPIPSQT